MMNTNSQRSVANTIRIIEMIKRIINHFKVITLVKNGKACNRCGHKFEVGEMKHYLESDIVGFMCRDCAEKSPEVWKEE